VPNCARTAENDDSLISDKAIASMRSFIVILRIQPKEGRGNTCDRLTDVVKNLQINLDRRLFGVYSEARPSVGCRYDNILYPVIY
jgi:hypothetical protein